jgi:hypothetical protein
MKWLDLVDLTNLLARAEAIVGMLTLGRARSKRHPKARKQHGGVALRLRRDNPGKLSGHDAVRELRRRGVRVWGGRTTSDYFVFYAPSAQAPWARYLVNRMALNQPLPPAWADKRKETGR